MYKDRKVVGVITARGGSKGLPGKNIKLFNGKPLIYWTIQSAQQSKYLDRLIITTDCAEIAAIAKSYNCEVPFLRPSELADDLSTSAEAITHALRFLDEKYDYVTILEPTSPLREAKDIDKSIEIIVDNKAQSVLSVSEVVSHHPNFLFTKNTSNELVNYLDLKFKAERRQDISTLYALDGTIYTVETAHYFAKEQVYSENGTIPLVLEPWKEMEIDTLIDFVAIEAIAKEFL